ncbi:MAG: TonB-dependent receptor [Nitrospirae bacterium]|nr:TonB-dependent receptor [Nitrospirota bacterium]
MIGRWAWGIVVMLLVAVEQAHAAGEPARDRGAERMDGGEMDSGPAASPASAGEDQPEMEELLSLIEEETEIATRTRMNADFVPGVVTVLDAGELKGLGARNVWEALSRVPGVQPVRDSLARPSVIVRGLYFPFNAGNIKILVDSVPLSRESAGINPFILGMPIEQVDRIEFIRGPGSVVHGDFAFMGLINIVTKKDDFGLFTRGETERRAVGGGRAAWSSGGEEPIRMFANVSGTGGRSASFLDGVKGDEQAATGVFGLGWRGGSLTGQLFREAITPEARGEGQSLPDEVAETDGSIELSYAREVSSDFHVNVRGGFLRNTMAGGGDDFAGNLLRAGIDARWEPSHRHALVAGFEHTTALIGEANHRRPPLPAAAGAAGGATAQPAGGPETGPGGSGPPAPRRQGGGAEGGAGGEAGPPGSGGDPAANQVPTPPPDVLVKDERRFVESLFVQDSITLGERWALTPGLRFDHFSDVDWRLTPRLSLVWRLTEHHILKSQYSEGYRAPTFFELAEQNPADPLDFEVVGTGELAYVFRRPNMVGRATGFYSRIRDMVYRVPSPTSPGFENSAWARSLGAEVEWSQQILWWLKATVNGAWAGVKDSRLASEGEIAPPWMYDVAAWLTPIRKTTLGLRFNQIAKRGLGDGYSTFDVSLARAFLADRLSLRVGAKNLFNDGIQYIATRPGRVDTTSLPGRLIWAGLEWSDRPGK